MGDLFILASPYCCEVEVLVLLRWSFVTQHFSCQGDLYWGCLNGL